MCLIIHKPAGVPIPNRLFFSAARQNADGIGIMYLRRGRMTIRRYVPADREPAARYQTVLRNLTTECADYDALIHLRMATHGSVSHANTHPFKVVPGLYAMHNGIMHGYGSEADGESDTVEFIRTVVRPLLMRDPSLLDSSAFRRLFEDAVTGSKWAFLDAAGRRWFFPAVHAWTVYEGLTLSNTYAWSAPWHLDRSYRGNTGGRLVTAYDWEQWEAAGGLTDPESAYEAGRDNAADWLPPMTR